MLLAFVPLIVDNSVFFPAITGKDLLIKSCLTLVSVLFTVNYFIDREFRKVIINKVSKLIKNPLALSIFVFIGIFIISTIFAMDKYGAFWGDVERGEGLAGIIYFFSFFVFSLFVFEKKEWLWFFKLSLFTTVILLFKEISAFVGGATRPSATIQNPAFLAGYLLSSILFSIIIFAEEKHKFWRFFSIAIFISSIAGIFITETRGTMAGLALGFIVLMIYGINKGRIISYKNINLRKISIIVLCLLVSFSVIFIATRKNELWQKIPGVNRVSLIGEKDPSSLTRLYSIKTSFDAVNPRLNGFKKMLIGWGPENFGLAFGRYLNPKQYAIEQAWFDRAHNKLLDILVMNGLLGLLSYLCVWVLFYISISKKRTFSLVDAGLIFFGTAFFIHLLFLFDQISTYIVFFAFLSFTTYSIDHDSNGGESKNIFVSENFIKIAGAFFIGLSIFFCFAFFKETIPAYFQMEKYISMTNYSDIDYVDKNIDSVFIPSTPAQMNIREDFIKYAVQNFNSNNPVSIDLLNKAIYRGEEYIGAHPYDFRFLSYFAGVYTDIGNSLGNINLMKKGEIYFNRAIEFSPNRQNFKDGLSANLKYQNAFLEQKK